MSAVGAFVESMWTKTKRVGSSHSSAIVTASTMVSLVLTTLAVNAVILANHQVTVAAQGIISSEDRLFQPNVDAEAENGITGNLLTRFPGLVCTLSKQIQADVHNPAFYFTVGQVSEKDDDKCLPDAKKTSPASSKEVIAGMGSYSVQNVIRTAAFASPQRVLDGMVAPDCLSGNTVMNIVAHEDDDILFMNPDLSRNIRSGHCIRTVFVTAGDAGMGQAYWSMREQGARAAYDMMDGPTETTWIDKTVRLGDHQYALFSVSESNPNISLIFLRLPDGNLAGQGFGARNHESLLALEQGRVLTIHSVDDQSHYSHRELVDALAGLINFYNPNQINTQASPVGQHYDDHSDHTAVGRYVKSAFEKSVSLQRQSLQYYIGYPIRDMVPNVSGEDSLLKRGSFLSYAQYDNTICPYGGQCEHVNTYEAYFSRQYTLAP